MLIRKRCYFSFISHFFAAIIVFCLYLSLNLFRKCFVIGPQTFINLDSRINYLVTQRTQCLWNLTLNHIIIIIDNYQCSVLTIKQKYVTKKIFKSGQQPSNTLTQIWNLCRGTVIHMTLALLFGLETWTKRLLAKLLLPLPFQLNRFLHKIGSAIHRQNVTKYKRCRSALYRSVGTYTMFAHVSPSDQYIGISGKEYCGTKGSFDGGKNVNLGTSKKVFSKNASLVFFQQVISLQIFLVDTSVYVYVVSCL